MYIGSKRHEMDKLADEEFLHAKVTYRAQCQSCKGRGYHADGNICQHCGGRGWYWLTIGGAKSPLQRDGSEG